MFIYETKLRSILKALSFGIIELIVEILILSFFVEIGVAIGLAVFFEVIYFIMRFLFERAWNKINFGRNVVCKKSWKGCDIK